MHEYIEREAWEMSFRLREETKPSIFGLEIKEPKAQALTRVQRRGSRKGKLNKSDRKKCNNHHLGSDGG